MQLVIERRAALGLVAELGAQAAERRTLRSAALGHAHRDVRGEDARVEQAQLPAEVGTMVVAHERHALDAQPLQLVPNQFVNKVVFASSRCRKMRSRAYLGIVSISNRLRKS